MAKQTTEPGKQGVNKEREIKMIEFQREQVSKWIQQIESDHAKVKDEKVYQANLAAANEKMEEWNQKLKKLNEDGDN